MDKIQRFFILVCCIAIAVISYNGCSAKFDNSRIRSLNIEARKYHDMGLKLSGENRIDDAIAAYTKSIDINPSAGAYNNRSAEYNRKGMYDMAITDANQAIFLNYKYPMPYFNRGNAYFKKNDFARALKDYSHAIDLDPGQAEFHYNQGQTYVRMGRDDKAIKSYAQAVKADPHYYPAYYNMACIYSKENDKANSLSCLEKAVSEGFSDAARLRQEAALKKVSTMPRFRLLLFKLEKKMKVSQ
jgi:tetratricopeptide (TPR) repeat protein